MRRFYFGIALIVLFEIANVFFIMPLPGSQTVRSIDVAYALYRARWLVRALAAVLVVSGARSVWARGGWRLNAGHAAIIAVTAVVYTANFKMSADHMYLTPSSLNMQPASHNVVERNRLVVGIELLGQARAYPVQFIGYHHQVRDTVGGRPVMVSFCTVCRTGRAFDPVVQGKAEDFRLVGMDHFNAMFEDRATGSWWRQANGEAITGSRKGATLTEIPSMQVTLGQWLAMHPSSLIMQPDATLASRYAKSFDFETGASRSTLTGTDTASWGDKSWVVGITLNGSSRAYDWNRLKKERVINDTLASKPIVLVIANDDASFAAFERPSADALFSVRGDSLVTGTTVYDFGGRGTSARLRPVQASQEFWHSWRTFQPATGRY